jgi:hypothetical protein
MILDSRYWMLDGSVKAAFYSGTPLTLEISIAAARAAKKIQEKDERLRQL